MRIKLFLLGLIFSAQYPITASAQEVPSACKKFRELLRQPGVKISVEAQRPVLLPDEVLEPVVVVVNQSDKMLEIPLISLETGMLIMPMNRRLNPKTKRFGFSSSVDKLPEAMAGEGIPICSFPTTDLNPGEERRFPLRFPSSVWTDESIPGNVIARSAASEEGKNAFELHMGYILVMGFYEIKPVTKLNFTCITEDGEANYLPGRQSAKQDPDCTLATLVKQGPTWYLFANRLSGPVSQLKNDLRLTRAAKYENPDDNLLYPPHGQIIDEFSSEPSFASSALSPITSRSEFAVVSAEGRKGFSDFKKSYRSIREKMFEKKRF